MIVDLERWGKKGLLWLFQPNFSKFTEKYCCCLQRGTFLSPYSSFELKFLSRKTCLRITTLIANSVKSACFDSSSMFLWHLEHNRDHPQHVFKSDCCVIQQWFSVCQAPRVRTGEREAGGQEMFRNQGVWGQARSLGSGEGTCLPGSSCACESAKECVFIARNGEVGSPRSHETFPCWELLCYSSLFFCWCCVFCWAEDKTCYECSNN